MNDLTPADLELLSAYLDDELAPAERAALERRLAADARLRAELEALRGVAARVRALPVLAAPRDFRLDPAVYGRREAGSLRTPIRSVPLRRFYGWASALSAAAAALILLVGVAGLLGSGALPYAVAPTGQQAAAPLTLTGEAQIAMAPTATIPLTLTPLETRETPEAVGSTPLPPNALAAESAIAGAEAAAPAAEATTFDGVAAAFSAADAAADGVETDGVETDSGEEEAPPAVLLAPGLRAGEAPATKSGVALPEATALPTATAVPTAVAIVPAGGGLPAVEPAAELTPTPSMPPSDPEALIGAGCALMALAVMFFALSRRAR